MTGLLDIFHPLIRRWFQGRFGGPTAAQEAAWPRIAAGEHVLVTAPTGSGKTLTAFLYAVDKLVSGAWSAGGVRVLYVSPLKALNNDIRKNLREPLAEIAAVFEEAGQPMPDVRVMTRSGDTPPSERRAVLSSPPSIFITTPESLNILLTSRRGRSLFSGIKTVILDEIHASAGSKRGTHLMCAVERVAALSGEFQRIALSATVNPPERIARFVGGFRVVKNEGASRLEPRLVCCVRPAADKSYALKVFYLLPERGEEEAAEEEKAYEEKPRGGISPENPVWRAAVEEMVRIIRKNRSTLVFAESRRDVERAAKLINEVAGETLVFAHHGSLSKDIREATEDRLRKGALKGVVATSSLELGIDVGAVEEVLMLKTPSSVASLMQRLGRAGHRAGEVSRGRIFALHPQDLINAAVCASALKEQKPEPVSPPEQPLDVLAQVILSMTAVGPMHLDELYDAVRAAEPYASLPRRLFDSVVEMLTGKCKAVRIPALRPRLAADGIDGTVRALPGAVRALYSFGGTIPDRGYFAVRVKQSAAKIGELDEEFVWERKLGDVITLGVQSWRIEEIGYSDVFVSPHRERVANPPFWTCEERGTSSFFALMRSAFLERAAKGPDEPSFMEALTAEHRLDEAAARELTDFLKRQRAAAGGAWAHRHQIMVEHIAPEADNRLMLTVIHTEWGGRVNRPFGIALKAALEEKLGEPVRVMSDDIATAIASETYLSTAELFSAVTASNVHAFVREHIQDTGVFGASFRENAARALVLLRGGFGKRTPLWLNRKRAKELRAAVASCPGFPVTVETYRACLNDEVDMNALVRRLEEVEAGVICIREVTVQRPTPFTEPVLHKLTDELVYERDIAPGIRADAHDSLIDEILSSDEQRPVIPLPAVRALKDKQYRTQPGYTPSDAIELLEWIKERILIPEDEWRALLFAMSRDRGLDADDLVAAVSHRVAAVGPSKGPFAIVAIESFPRIACLGEWILSSATSPFMNGEPCCTEARAAMKKVAAAVKNAPGSLQDLLIEQLRFCSPATISELSDMLYLPTKTVEETTSSLLRNTRIITGTLTEDAAETQVCLEESFRMLLFLARGQASLSVETRPADTLPLFIAARQKIAFSKARTLEETMEPLFGTVAAAGQWEQEILPARLPSYRARDLDVLLSNSNLQWTEQKKDSFLFCLKEERDLFFMKKPSLEDIVVSSELFPDPEIRLTAAELAARLRDTEAEEVEDILLDLTAKQCVSADTFKPARRGRKKTADPRPAGTSARWSFRRHRAEENPPRWYRPAPPDTDRDAMAEELVRRDRARILLDRFGVVFRELLEREIQPLKWSSLFRTFRRMELSGEVIGGHFFEGVKGLQFIAKDALHILRDDRGDDAPVYWMSAKDPASLCGVKIDGLSLPQRTSGTHLVFCRKKLVLVSKRSGKTLTFYTEPDDPRLEEYLEVFSVMLRRDRQPLSFISIEKINGRRAWRSPFREAFERRFDIHEDFGALRIMKRY